MGEAVGILERETRPDKGQDRTARRQRAINQSVVKQPGKKEVWRHGICKSANANADALAASIWYLRRQVRVIHHARSQLMSSTID